LNLTGHKKSYSEIGLEIALTAQELPHSQRFSYISNQLQNLDPEVRALTQHIALAVVQLKDPGEIELAKERIRTRSITVISIAAFIFGLAFVILGVFFVTSKSLESNIDAWGLSVSTNSAGIASIALGVILVIFTVRAAFKHI